MKEVIKRISSICLNFFIYLICSRTVTAVLVRNRLRKCLLGVKHLEMRRENAAY